MLFDPKLGLDGTLFAPILFCVPLFIPGKFSPLNPVDPVPPTPNWFVPLAKLIPPPLLLGEFDPNVFVELNEDPPHMISLTVWQTSSSAVVQTSSSMS